MVLRYSKMYWFAHSAQQYKYMVIVDKPLAYTQKCTHKPKVCGCYSISISCSPSSIDEIYIFTFMLVSNSIMKHQQKPGWNSNHPIFTYVYQKCTLVDSFSEYTDPSNCVQYTPIKCSCPIKENTQITPTYCCGRFWRLFDLQMYRWQHEADNAPYTTYKTFRVHQHPVHSLKTPPSLHALHP